MDLMPVLVYATALLLLVSVALFVKAALFDKRPQKFGLILAILAVPLYAVYYTDRWPWGVEPEMADRTLREALRPLANLEGANTGFESDFAPAVIIAAILLIHLTVFQRVAVRRRLQRVHDPIANFLASATVATLIGGTVVSTFALGWVGAVVIGGVFTLVYLGALAMLAAIIEIMAELSKLFAVWIKRKVFTLATMITRAASWISSLGGRLVSRGLIERIRADTAAQESRFADEQDAQDRRLEDAYVRDRRRAAKRRGQLRAQETPAPLPAEPVQQVADLPAAEGASGTA